MRAHCASWLGGPPHPPPLALVGPRDNRGRTKARTSACCRSCLLGFPEKALHFLETGPDCAHCRRARLVGFISSTLVAIVILNVPFDVGGANDDSTILPLFSRATPGSCFLRREAMILLARIFYTCVTRRTGTIRDACRGFISCFRNNSRI